MVTTITFSQDFFRIFKNGQKKCPKSKTKNTFGFTFSLKYNKFTKQLKEMGQEINYLKSEIFICKYNQFL